MICWALDCADDGTERFVTKPIGTWSLAGAQIKLVATKVVLCDKHWSDHLTAVSA